MASLTAHYTAMRASMLKGIDLPDSMRKAQLDSGSGQILAGMEICKTGMSVSYRLTITRGNSTQAHDVSAYVRFTHTFPHYGGRRLWFICPRCGRRCAILYLGSIVACRNCLRLYYPCSYEGRLDRGWRLHHRWQARIMDGKPKGMHWQTYHDLSEKVNRRALAKLVPILGMMEKRMRK